MRWHGSSLVSPRDRNRTRERASCSPPWLRPLRWMSPSRTQTVTAVEGWVGSLRLSWFFTWVSAFSQHVLM